LVRKPQQPPITWTIYKIAAKQTSIGEVEAAAAAKEFRLDARRLIAVRQA
jgi:hypothetical protein